MHVEFSHWANGGSQRTPTTINTPIELFEIIARYAAQDKHTGTSLACVSKAVNLWIIPILYKCVDLHTALDIQLLQRTLEGPSGKQLALHLQTLYMGIFTAELGQIMSEICINIHSVIVPQMKARWLIDLNPPNDIPWLTILGPLRPLHLSTHSTPVLKSVTHLRFPSDTPDGDFGEVKKLSFTHFACVYKPIKRGITGHIYLWDVIQLLLKMETIEVLVFGIDLRKPTVHVSPTEIKKMEEYLRNLEQKDRRVVVYTSDSMELKEKMTNEEFWRYAEGVISARM
ncbi:hypothetical protein C8J55DRAFT_561105 [Lentinula edodes]|uniref:Uncharacterized protein n=1 Tax=Lentinula lateritia TaxID=40482 RepID=A0A9W9DPI5_9AGAR|nr:hypothetical protein C8J55DRAFT_561105 [Lentinula edodes]